MSFDQLPPPILARRDGDRLHLSGPPDESLRVTDDGGGRLRLTAPRGGLDAALAAFDALSATGDECVILLDGNGWQNLMPALLERGIALPFSDEMAVFPALFWQVPERWLIDPTPPWPEYFVSGPHGRHPLRPPKPQGMLYRRFIPWLDRWFTLRALSMEDLPLFHRWQNDPRVVAFFEEEGSLDQHRAYLQRLLADPHILPVIGTLDGHDFAYFELYWARENRLGAVHDCSPWDRGWHVLIGEEDIRGADYLTAWLPSLMHYMFLTEPRCDAILGEPRANHEQQLRNLTRSGFARLRNVDFTHKRAALVRLERQHFFEERLWARAPDSDGQPLRLSPSIIQSRSLS